MRGREYECSTTAPPAADRLAHATRRLLGVEHAVADADEPADAATSRQSLTRVGTLTANLTRLMSAAARTDRRHRHRLRRPRHRRRLRRARHRGRAASTSTPTRSRASKRGEIPIYEPGLAELVAKNRERLHFSTDLADALEHARLLFVAVGTPPTYSGDADLSAVHAVVDAMPASDRHALVMKSTVPVGTGASIKRVFAEQGKDGFRYVSCPEFLKEGSAVEDFLQPDRVVVGDDGDWAGDAVVDLYAPLDAPLVRTDIASAEMVKLAVQRLPGDEDLVHQRDRQRLRGDRRRRRRGRARDGPRRPHRAEVPAGGHRLRRLVLPEGRHRAQAARGQLRLPLPAAERGHRGQRAAEAARHRQAPEAPRLARRQADRAARPGVQARTPTTCARRPRSCSSARLQADGAPGRRVRPGRRGRGAAADPGRASSPPARSPRSRTRTPSCSSPSGRSSRSSTGRDVAAAHARDLVVDGRNALDAAAVRAAGLSYEGIGRGTVASLALP